MGATNENDYPSFVLHDTPYTEGFVLFPDLVPKGFRIGGDVKTPDGDCYKGCLAV